MSKTKTKSLFSVILIILSIFFAVTFLLPALIKNDSGKAEGATGKPGKGIESIEKTATHGLIDTYTITYTDGTTYIYAVTNGADGSGGGATSAVITSKSTAEEVKLIVEDYEKYKMPIYFCSNNYYYYLANYIEFERYGEDSFEFIAKFENTDTFMSLEGVQYNFVSTGSASVTLFLTDGEIDTFNIIPYSVGVEYNNAIVFPEINEENIGKVIGITSNGYEAVDAPTGGSSGGVTFSNFAELENLLMNGNYMFVQLTIPSELLGSGFEDTTIVATVSSMPLDDGKMVGLIGYENLNVAAVTRRTYNLLFVQGIGALLSVNYEHFDNNGEVTSSGVILEQTEIPLEYYSETPIMGRVF